MFLSNSSDSGYWLNLEYRGTDRIGKYFEGNSSRSKNLKRTVCILSGRLLLCLHVIALHTSSYSDWSVWQGQYPLHAEMEPNKIRPEDTLATQLKSISPGWLAEHGETDHCLHFPQEAPVSKVTSQSLNPLNPSGQKMRPFLTSHSKQQQEPDFFFSTGTCATGRMVMDGNAQYSWSLGQAPHLLCPEKARTQWWLRNKHLLASLWNPNSWWYKILILRDVTFPENRQKHKGESSHIANGRMGAGLC